MSADAGFAAVFRSASIPVKTWSITVRTATKSSIYTNGCEAIITQITTEEKSQR